MPAPVSTAAPDAAAGQEAALVAGGLPYLERVWSDDQWALYEVAHPTPLAAPPAEVLDFDAAQVTVFTPGPGPVVIRIAYSRWLGLVDALGKPLDEAMSIHEEFLTLMQGKGQVEPDEDVLEDGIAFAGVAKFPARIKCALLGWMAWKDATAQATEKESR